MVESEALPVKVLLVALSILASVSAIAAAPDMSVFGIRFGEQLTIGECPKGTYVHPVTCYSADPYMKIDKYGRELGTIHITNEQESQNYQDGFSVRHPSVVLIQGAVEHLLIETQGDIASQESILRLLSKKYGKPSLLKKRLLQNAFGARFSSYFAQWRFKELSIDYDGGTVVNDGGSIEIYTPKYLSAERQAEADTKKKTVGF